MVKDPWLCDCSCDQLVHSFAGPCLVCSCQSFTTDRCECEFEADPNDPEDDDPWHYRRVCLDPSCGTVWYSLHCEHDRTQEECPGCNMIYFRLKDGVHVTWDLAEPIEVKQSTGHFEHHGHIVTWHEAKSEYIEVKAPDWGDKDSA